MLQSAVTFSSIFIYSDFEKRLSPKHSSSTLNAQNVISAAKDRSVKTMKTTSAVWWHWISRGSRDLSSSSLDSRHCQWKYIHLSIHLLWLSVMTLSSSLCVHNFCAGDWGGVSVGAASPETDPRQGCSSLYNLAISLSLLVLSPSLLSADVSLQVIVMGVQMKHTVPC